jgi:hypothetical protein
MLLPGSMRCDAVGSCAVRMIERLDVMMMVHKRVEYECESLNAENA